MVKSYYEEIKTVTTNFDEKYITCKTLGFYVVIAFLLITILLC